MKQNLGPTSSKKNIDKLERVHCQAIQFRTGDYTSGDQGCVLRMLADLQLPLLQDRRKTNWLVFLYKVVEGQVPALQSHNFLTPVQGKCLIKSKHYIDYETSNRADKQ